MKEVYEKYYTPEIEEFNIGFEYEERSFNEAETDVWTKHTYNLSKHHEGTSWSLEAILRQGAIRVKYLDRDDIEELDYEFVEFLNIRTMLFYKTKNRVKHIVEENDLNFLTLKNRYSVVEIHSDLHSVYHTKHGFNGTVKNKSELKTVLKQVFKPTKDLAIIEDEKQNTKEDQEAAKEN